jgi:hypothetical protein
MAQVVNPEQVRNLRPFFKGINDSPILRVSVANVANPPTAAELTATFDAPANLPDGWMGVVDDAGAGSAVWLVTAVGGDWWYEALTKAA